MSEFRAYRRLVYWDWVHEMKRKETVASMTLFSLITLFVFSRAIPPESLQGVSFHAGVLWVTFLLAGAIGIDRAFRGSSGGKVLEGLLLSPVGRITIYYAKLTSTFLFLSVMEVVILFLFVILYNLDVGLVQLGQLAGVIALTTVGFVAVGVTLSAMTRAIHGGDVLLRILLFAMLIPVFWAAVDATGAIIDPNDKKVLEFNQLGIIAAFDVIYLATGQLVFGPIMSDFDEG